MHFPSDFVHGVTRQMVDDEDFFPSMSAKEMVQNSLVSYKYL